MATEFGPSPSFLLMEISAAALSRYMTPIELRLATPIGLSGETGGARIK